MGGVKKRPISQAEKAQQAAEKRAEEKKEKEKGKRPAVTEKQASFSTRIDEKSLNEVFASSKALTVYELASKLSIPPSLANSTLKAYEARGLLEKVAGYSGHYVYRVTKPAS